MRVLGALVLLVVVQSAHALDVRGIHLGNRWNSEKFERALSDPTIPTSQRVKCSEQGDPICVGATRFLAHDVRVKIEGGGGQVRKITITLPSGEFDSALVQLKHAFGEPTDEWSSPPTATGPLLFHHRADWKQPNEELFALQFATMATLSLTTPAESLASQYPPTM
jgi:hypothetical protein